MTDALTEQVEATARSLTPAMVDTLAAIGDGPDADGYEPSRMDFDLRTLAALDRRGLVSSGFELRQTEFGRQVAARAALLAGRKGRA